MFTVVGMLHDHTGSHTYSFCVAGALIALAGLVSVPMRRLKNTRISGCCKHTEVEETDSTQNFAGLEIGAPQEIIVANSERTISIDPGDSYKL